MSDQPKFRYLHHCNSNYISKPSQIVCIATTVHVMCMQAALCVHKNLCMVLIPLCKNNLNLPISHTVHKVFQENKNNHYHSVFNFQHSSLESLQTLYISGSQFFASLLQATGQFNRSVSVSNSDTLWPSNVIYCAILYQSLFGICIVVQLHTNTCQQFFLPSCHFYSFA